MEKIFVLGMSLLVVIVMLSVLLNATFQRKHTLLGVAMTRNQMNSTQAKKIARSCRVSISGVSVVFVGALWLLWDITKDPARLLIFLAWIFGYIFSLVASMQFFSRKMSKLRGDKTAENKKTSVAVDTEVVRLKKDMMVSPWWMLPGFILSLIPFIPAIIKRSDEFLWMTAGMSLLFCVIYWFMRLTFSRGRSDAYSKSADINRACHYHLLHSWSVCMAVLSVISALCFIVLYLIYAVFDKAELSFAVFPVLIISMIGGFLFTDIHVRTVQNRLLNEEDDDEEPIDESDCWKWGFYNNPNNPKIMVEKRYGGGWTLNLGTKAGRWITGVTFTLVGTILLFTVFISVGVYTVPMEMNIENDTVKITAAMYDTEFKTNEIKEVKLVNRIPNGVRTNGASMGALQLGHFQLDGYGNSLLYLSQENPPYLLIRLEDKTIIFDGGSGEETERLYKELAVYKKY